MFAQDLKSREIVATVYRDDSLSGDPDTERSRPSPTSNRGWPIRDPVPAGTFAARKACMTTAVRDQLTTDAAASTDCSTFTKKASTVETMPWNMIPPLPAPVRVHAGRTASGIDIVRTARSM